MLSADCVDETYANDGIRGLSRMYKLQDGFEVLGVVCFPTPEAESRFFYLPLAADCQRSDDGKPAANLIVAGATAFLQIATVWDVSAGRLEEVRHAVAGRIGIDDPALVQLAFAPVTVDSVRLLSGDGDVAETELATAHSSGMAPHSAMFNLQLDSADQARAAAAFNGRIGFLSVRYEASLRALVRHEARLRGNLSGVWSASDLEHALTSGRAVLEIAPEDVGLRGALIDRAVEILNLSAGPAEGETEILVELSRSELVSVTVGTDVGTWFGGSDPSVLPSPGFGGPQPSRPEPDDGARETRPNVSLDIPGAENCDSLIEVKTDLACGRPRLTHFDRISLETRHED